MVERYFRWIGRDPARTLELLSPEFHLAHGLRVAALEGFLWGGWGFPAAGAASVPAAPVEETREMRVEGAQLAWLMVQRARFLRRIAPTFQIELVEQAEDAANAFIVVRVRSKRFAPFVQRFDLARPDPQDPWRITAIEQRAIDAANAPAAMAAYPSLANLQRIRERDRRGNVHDEHR
jgi:hypothetical protein